ncbi:hypothetical protein GCM10027597_36890 [Saccharopolyspora tripterygii]
MGIAFSCSVFVLREDVAADDACLDRERIVGDVLMLPDIAVIHTPRNDLAVSSGFRPNRTAIRFLRDWSLSGRRTSGTPGPGVVSVRTTSTGEVGGFLKWQRL